MSKQTSTNASTNVVTLSDRTDVNQAALAALAGDVAAFVALDRSGRALTRSALTRGQTAAIPSGDALAALASDPVAMASAMGDVARYATALALLASVSSARPVAASVDYVAATALRIAGLRFAADALENGSAVIEGTPDDAPHLADDADPCILANAALAYVMTSDDEALALAVAARRITRSGPTNDVAAGIQSALIVDDVRADEGTFVSLSTIGKRWAAAGGPAAAQSGGRITSRVFAASGCTVPGIEPADAITGKRPRGVLVRAVDYVHADALAGDVDGADVDASDVDGDASDD